METQNIVLQDRPEPELRARVSAALFIAAFGIDCGIGTKYAVMWPYAVFDDDDVKRTSAKLLASVHTALLEALLPAQIEQISKALAGYLSVACGDGSLDETDRSPVIVLRRQE